MNGFRDVVDGAELEADDAVHVLASGSQHDDGHLAPAADPATHLEPVDAGEHHVEQDDVVRLGRRGDARDGASTVFFVVDRDAVRSRG